MASFLNFTEFIYSSPDEDEKDYTETDLRQGDILEKTSELSSILDEIYPYHSKEKTYPYFMVLTQSCDLVRRKDEEYPRADCITLAAVRPINYFLNQLFSRYQHKRLRGSRILLSEKKGDLKRELERLISNDLPPYFYLHPTDKTPFHDSQVVYLRITLPFRTEDHFRALLAAKKLELIDVFKAKLGWLTAQVYSRVGTKGFRPEERNKIVSELINGVPDYEWFRRNALENIIKRQRPGSSFNKVSITELQEIMADIDLKKEHKNILNSSVDQIIKIIKDTISLNEAQSDDLKNSLVKDSSIKKLLTNL